MDINDYLYFLKIAVSSAANHTEIQQTEEGPVLLCTFRSPLDGNSEMGCRIALIPNDNGSVTAEMMLFVFAGIGKDMFEDLDILINAVNERIITGSYRLFDNEGTILFVQSLLLNETLDEKTATAFIGKTLSAMEDTVSRSAGVILSYLSGNELESILNELDKGVE